MDTAVLSDPDTTCFDFLPAMKREAFSVILNKLRQPLGVQ